MLRYFIILGLLFSSSAFAIKSQCIQGVDWLPFCGMPDAPSLRCALAPGSTWATHFCAPETDGCAELGGCFGDVPPGYWYPFMENGQSYKCRCGCVAADETNFETSHGTLSGRDLYAQRKKGEIQVTTVDSLNTPWINSPKPINTIMAAKSHEKSFRIETRSGRSVIASPGHPVLISNAQSEATLMKKASDVRAGEYVLTSDGVPDEIARVSIVDYKLELMNFNVASRNSDEHVVAMNGILLGDYAWQERLNSRDSRVLLRSQVARDLMKRVK